MIKNYLFDLDGTLLPLDEKMFLDLYIKHIGMKFASLGLDANQMVQKLWAGTEAMIQNEGSSSNEDVFWHLFCPEKVQQKQLKMSLTSFYKNEFINVKSSTNPNPYAIKIINHLKKMNKNIYLLTNPIFPEIATRQRIKWAGLQFEDFNHVTTYENSIFAKPNLDYYRSVMERFNLKPEETMMVGNDVNEDMIAEKLGLDTYLILNCLKNPKYLDISKFKKGKLKDFYQYILEQY